MNVFMAGKSEEIRPKGAQLIKQYFKGGRKKKFSNNLHGVMRLFERENAKDEINKQVKKKQTGLPVSR